MLFQQGNYGFRDPVAFRSGVAVLGKGVTIAGEARLAVNVDKLTEHAITQLEEH